LSRTLAQDVSLVTITSTPYFANSPNSFAITIGEQSVSGINPSFIGSFAGGLKENNTIVKHVKHAVSRIGFLNFNFFMVVYGLV
jgi:hypothetical protein